ERENGLERRLASVRLRGRNSREGGAVPDEVGCDDRRHARGPATAGEYDTERAQNRRRERQSHPRPQPPLPHPGWGEVHPPPEADPTAQIRTRPRPDRADFVPTHPAPAQI